jgi:acetylglutamate kinase
VALSRRFNDVNQVKQKICVVKIGGDVLLDEVDRHALGKNVRALWDEGLRLCILHGGGPQVSRLQRAVGLVPHMVGGRRVTSAEDLRVVEQAICGEVNVGLCSTLLAHGVPAFGCHGASGALIRAHKRPPTVVTGAGPDPVDFGEVGDVTTIHAPLLFGLLAMNVVPVIATLGVDESGRVFNINADTTCVALAKTLGADHLLLSTKVGAVYRNLDDKTSRYARLSAQEARRLIKDGIVKDGMIPKLEEAISVLSQGVGTISIVAPSEDGAFLAAARLDDRIGTHIVADL